MTQTRSIVCTVLARGGSKGVKNKNIRELGGKPLIIYTLEQAAEAGCFDAIGVSSDSVQILEIARAWGVEFLVQRPLELASHKAGKIGAICHCVEQIENRRGGGEFDFVVDLDVTCPFKTAQDVCAAIEILRDPEVSNVVSGSIARKSPYFNVVELNDLGFVQICKQPSTPVVRRQDSPICYQISAPINVWRRKFLFGSTTTFMEKTKIYVMPEERCLDIDSELDFSFAEFLLGAPRSNTD